MSPKLDKQRVAEAKKRLAEKAKQQRIVQSLKVTRDESFKPGKENPLLSMMLSIAVPLCCWKYAEWSAEERQAEIAKLDAGDFAYRMENVLHRGKKEGETARAFNDLASAIALLSFAPGGVSCFGQHYEWI